jgi:hypothetical protein
MIIRNEDVRGREVRHEARHELAGVIRLVAHDDPTDQRMRPAGVGVEAGHLCVDDLIGHRRMVSSAGRKT